MFPEVPPLCHNSPRLRDQKYVSPLSRVSCSDWAFIYASMSTSCVCASCTIAGMSPLISNFSLDRDSFMVNSSRVPHRKFVQVCFADLNLFLSLQFSTCHHGKARQQGRRQLFLPSARLQSERPFLLHPRR